MEKGWFFGEESRFCNLCNVELLNKDVAAAHFNGRLHKSQVERAKKREQNAERGIFIRREDISTITDDELMSLFKPYGEIVQIKRPTGPNKAYCVVKFVDSACVQRALSEPHYVKGKILPCSPEKPFGVTLNMRLTTNKPPSTPRRRQPSDPPSRELFDVAELPAGSGTSFKEIVDEFIKKIEVEPGLEDKYKLVCSDLEYTFANELPGVKARLFGSTITGLAFKESDLDIFMECPDGQPGRNFVAKRTDQMFRVGLFKNIIKISHARVPVVKCIHIRTGISCDVTFMSKLGVTNSYLIRFLISLDERLRPLLMMLKYWGRVHDITGVGKFSNYALVILVVFYLQQLDNPILPSIKFLQDLCEDKDYCLHMQVNWECSFCDDKSKVPSNKNDISLKELLFGFFTYYSELDFKKYIVSPSLGKIIDKNYFKTDNEKSISDLPEDVSLFVQRVKELPKEAKFTFDVPFSVHDPFDLSANLTKCITEKLCKRFKWLCDYSKDHVFCTATNDCDLIKLLFTPPVVPEPKSIMPDKIVINIPMTSIILPGTTEKYRLSDDYKLIWFKCIKDAILLVFEAIYKFKILPNDKHTRLMRGRHYFGSPEFVYKNLSYRCYGDSPVFHSRKKSEKQLLLTKVSCLEREVRISEYIMLHHKEPSVFMADMELLCYPNLTPPTLRISMVDVCKQKFNTFKGFAAWIQTYIEEHCKLAVKYNEANNILYNNLKQTHTRMDCSSSNTDVRDVEQSNDLLHPVSQIKQENNSMQSQSKMDCSSSNSVIRDMDQSNDHSQPVSQIKQECSSEHGEPSESTTAQNSNNMPNNFSFDSSTLKSLNLSSPNHSNKNQSNVQGKQRNRRFKRSKQRSPYYKNSINDIVYQPDPGSLLLKAIEKPLYVEEWGD